MRRDSVKCWASSPLGSNSLKMKTNNAMKKKDFYNLKPSQLLRVALDDLKQVEKDSRYEVDMDHWHYNNHLNVTSCEDERCLVCFAGSVMAKTFKEDPSRSLGMANFSKAFQARMNALNDFRKGEIQSGLEGMGIFNAGIKYRTVVSYYDNPQKFKRQMARLALDLKGHGL